MTIRQAAVAAVVVLAVSACGGGRGGGADQEGTAGSPSAATSQRPAAQAMSVHTATPPKNDCDWIPVSEVEAIVGKLAGPPRVDDGCRYTLVMPDQVREARDKEIHRFQTSDPETAAMLAKRNKEIADPANYAMTLSVGWTGATGSIQVSKEALARMFAAELGTPAGGTSALEKPAEGWDDGGPRVQGFSGRIGHIQITVDGESADVPAAPMALLAARVRDRIPDLPFPVQNKYQVMIDVPAGADPCGLVTRAEAEAVVGPLVVDPYRASSEFPPLAHPDGHACAYFTAGHHVFVLSPEWTHGARSYALEAGIGGLVRQVMPQQEEVIFKGPWDKGQVTMNGSLAFLKGDRLLNVNFLMSSTNRRGALKLATLAMKRLSAMTVEATPEPTAARPAPGAGGTAPGWSRTLKLSDGRTMVADGAFVLDAAIARPAALPRVEVNGATIEKFLTADLPSEIPITDLAPGPRPRTYLAPGHVTLNADYIDYVRRTLPANRVRIRTGAGRPAVILLDGKPVGLLMPTA